MNYYTLLANSCPVVLPPTTLPTQGSLWGPSAGTVPRPPPTTPRYSPPPPPSQVVSEIDEHRAFLADYCPPPHTHSQVVSEIDERRAFLADMEQHKALKKEHVTIVQAELKERLADLQRLDRMMSEMDGL